MTSRGISAASFVAGFMSALLTLILVSGIVSPCGSPANLSQSPSCLPRARGWGMIPRRVGARPMHGAVIDQKREKKMAGVPMDQRDGWIWMDGNLVPWKDAKVHVLTHGLHYASSVFEGERLYNGRIYKLEEHTARLFESARILDMEIPYTEDKINKATLEAVAAQGFTDAY